MKTAMTVIGVLALALSQQSHAQSETDRYSQKTLLKNWALSRCLGEVYTDAKTKEDAYAAASAYLEFGRQPIEVYEALSTVVNKYASRSYAGSVNSNFNTMKCIDLLNSKELDELTNKFSKRK
jgi:hypothetical protein